ncbi:MAG: hypothetical protein Q9191_000229 [Dirinaria sp. TL-2023a]
MATQGESALFQFSRVPGQVICHTCGVELVSHEKLRWKKSALENQNVILHQRLFEAGQANQFNEVRMRFFNAQSEEVAKLKEIVSNYQKAFATQQEALELEKRERALVTQSLNHEFSCHKATERSLEQERAHVRDFIGFLNTLEIPRRADLNDNASIGTIWLEGNDMKAALENLEAKTKSLEQKLYNIRDDLQHKRLLLKELSRNFEIALESTFMTSISESSEEENEQMMLLSELGEQRKRVVGINDLRLLDPGRMSQLVRELRNSSNQRPSSLLFVGRQVKDLALRELFLDNNFKKHFCDGVAILRIDNASIYFDHPIFFAESSSSQVIPLAVEDPRVDETESFPIQWAEDTTVQHLYNVLHARLFCLFIDVVCVFADDFVDFDHAVQLLKSWAAVDSASVHFNKIRSRVVIVRRGDAASFSPIYDLLRIDDLQQGLHNRSLKEFFSSIKVLHLTAEQLSPLARFRRLKELL